MNKNSDIKIKEYKVLTVCMTYNHSKYISDALDGFAVQKTNFPFACLILDDASNDGEPELIRDWLERECDMSRAEYYDLDLSNVIVVPHNTNENCTMAVYLLKRNLYEDGALKFELARPWGEHSEYIALCEGDDYWTDPEKLQIQSDCLDAHPEVDMCAHSYIEKHAVTGKTIRKKHSKRENCIIPVEDVILGGGDYFATDSVVFRTKIMNTIPRFVFFLPIDYSLFIYGALSGGVIYVSRVMSVYRRYVPGSWATKIDREKGLTAFKEVECKALDIFDEEYDYKYHSAIIIRKFLSSVLWTNTPFRNISITMRNKKVFVSLPVKQKLLIIGECICPKLGHYIKKYFSTILPAN